MTIPDLSKPQAISPTNGTNAPASENNSFDRRTLLMSSGAVLLAGAAYFGVKEYLSPTARVFIARGQRYDGPLVQTIADGLIATGIDTAWLRGKNVLLKPNLVEPTRRAPHLTTHPSVVVATAEVFTRWGAVVTVGEAPGHVRDTEMALAESQLGPALASAKIPFADLNYQTTAWLPNHGKTCKLDGFHFPQAVVQADLIVSLPKLKTHHWAGITAAMKNMYGTIPGIRYGWPKNVLHYNGIPQTVHDINASLPNTITVVDAITCMEGDGPIMGTPKQLGLILVGTNPTAVDATAARIMGLRPEGVSYLQLAAGKLGPIAQRHIEQRGESWQELVSPFEILDVPHLRSLRDKPGVFVT
ncbi:MAG: DUF362 domain-containing protein [Pirellulales bacterium]|nr:DUF362 domain-containing protein [Pirellulales bacterium]